MDEALNALNCLTHLAAYPSSILAELADTELESRVSLEPPHEILMHGEGVRRIPSRATSAPGHRSYGIFGNRLTAHASGKANTRLIVTEQGNSLHVPASMPEAIVSASVRAGQPVAAGDLLASLEAPDG